jgi:hypothetical protein
MRNRDDLRRSSLQQKLVKLIFPLNTLIRNHNRRDVSTSNKPHPQVQKMYDIITMLAHD